MVLYHRNHCQGTLHEQKDILMGEGKGPSRSAGLLRLMQPPEQQLLGKSQEARKQSTDVLFLLYFLGSLRIIFTSIWATHRKIVHTAAITLPLLPFPNNVNFKYILVTSCFHHEEDSTAPPKSTLGKTRAIDLETATFISNAKENTSVNDKKNLLCFLRVITH